MKNVLSVCILFLAMPTAWGEKEKKKPPNIITILADDLGWNDVGFHGSSQIPTPNIDALAYNGIILNSHYVQPLCTPSRAAFLTGKYPMNIGMQHSVLLEPEPRGLPLDQRLLPEHLQAAGYRTHAVGKWHLGFYRSEYTPTHRGFDSHYGYWNGLQDYYNHNVTATFLPEMTGYDMRRNMEVDYSARGKYSTELFTEEAVKVISDHDTSAPLFLYLAHLAPHTGNMDNPFQAPEEEIAKFAHIADPERRVYAAMVSVLDQGVGKLIAALRSKRILDNSIILFISDNGAPTYGVHSNRGSNYPLRGQKESPWEGASRGVAAVWSPLFKKTKFVSNHLMHVIDWLPTFWTAAGQDLKDLGDIDGISMWDALTNDNPSPRTDVVLNIDPVVPYTSIRHGEWKYINGTTANAKYDQWYGDLRPFISSYDAEAVLSSRASIAITNYITERQIKEKRASNETVTYTMEPLLHHHITELREAAQVNCSSQDAVDAIPCDPLSKPCLFNIKDDPCERVNLANVRTVILASLAEMVQKYKASSKPPANVPMDLDADPAKHNFVWSNWRDDVIRPKSVLDDFSSSAKIALTVLGIVSLCSLMIVVFASLNRLRCIKQNRHLEFMKRPMSISRDHFGHKRNPSSVSNVSVAQRVEMFEDKEHTKLKTYSQDEYKIKNEF